MTSIPIGKENISFYLKNEYTNANSLREPMLVIPHNDDIFYID